MGLLRYMAAFFSGNFALFYERKSALIAAETWPQVEERRWKYWLEQDQREIFVPAPRGGYVLVGGEIDVTNVQDTSRRFIAAIGEIHEPECRNCGAPVGPHEHRCSWCGSYPEIVEG